MFLLAELSVEEYVSQMTTLAIIATVLGVIGVCLGALLYAIFVMGSPSTAVKVVVIGALVITTNPVGAHAIAKGAYQAGIRPEKRMETDDYRRDFDE